MGATFFLNWPQTPSFKKVGIVPQTQKTFFAVTSWRIMDYPEYSENQIADERVGFYGRIGTEGGQSGSVSQQSHGTSSSGYKTSDTYGLSSKWKNNQ